MKQFFKKILYFIARIILKFCSPGLNPRIRLGDKIWTLRMFLRAHHRFPSKDKLIFNDVLYRIKTSDDLFDPLRTFTNDKELVKLYVKAVVGQKYVVPTIAILRSCLEIEKFNFPKKCCIKPTHASTKIFFRRNNESIDKSVLKNWMSLNYYNSSREISYKYLKPKIIVEPLLFDKDPNDLKDFKFFCYKGVPKIIQVDFNRHTNHSRNLYDTQWNELPYSTKPLRNPYGMKKPSDLKEMLRVASDLSRPFDFVRIDLYNNGKILVGEITHCHGNATEFFYPRNGEIEASKLIFKN